MNKIKFQVIDPYDFWLDPRETEVNALYPRWWHKFIFWKKWVYPKFPQRVKRVKLSDLI